MPSGFGYPPDFVDDYSIAKFRVCDIRMREVGNRRISTADRFRGINMRKSYVFVVLSLSVLSIVTSSALACGEAVFRAGKGVHYRAFTAPIPGTVLVYARTDSDRVVAENLQQAGHTVRVVSTDAELATEIREQPFDVVLAPFNLRDAVAMNSAKSTSRPEVIPVLDRESDDVRLAKAEFDEVLMSDDDVRKYLKAIHHILKDRGA